MEIRNHASEFRTKTFAATSTSELDDMIGFWQDSNPDAFVVGMELTSHWNGLVEQVMYVVIMTYMEGETLT